MTCSKMPSSSSSSYSPMLSGSSVASSMSRNSLSPMVSLVSDLFSVGGMACAKPLLMCGLGIGLSPMFAIYLFASSGSETRDSRLTLPAGFTLGGRSEEEGALADAGALEMGECEDRPVCIMEEYPAIGCTGLAWKGCEGLGVGCERKGDNESLIGAGATPVFNLGADPGPAMGLLPPLAYTL